jgi:ABC-type hemin transport system ATPase subunit
MSGSLIACGYFQLRSGKCFLCNVAFVSTWVSAQSAAVRWFLLARSSMFWPHSAKNMLRAHLFPG